MFNKAIIAGLTAAILFSGGYFTSPSFNPTSGQAFAATIIPGKNAGKVAPVSVMQVSESTMQGKMTNTSRYAVFVGTSAPFTEYWTTAPTADEAAQAILSRVQSGYFRTSNARLYNSMMRKGSFYADKTYPSHGSTVYCFRH